MASDVVKVEFMTKRSVMKSRFKTENFKGRWFVLTTKRLSYYEGKIDQADFLPESKSRMKGTLQLKNVKVVELIEPVFLSNQPNAFQVMYTDDTNGDLYTLYIMAISRDSREEWVTLIREWSDKCSASTFDRFHFGTYNFRAGRWTCCEKIQKQAQGCEETTWTKEGSKKQKGRTGETSPSPLNNNKRPNNRLLDIPTQADDKQPTNQGGGRNVNRPVPPVPSSVPEEPSTQTTETVTAMYDYQKVETDDLSLEKGESYEILDKEQQFWWQAKNRKGEIGYIPANYVQKVQGDELEQYDWFYPMTSRAQSEEVLRKEGRDGCFLVRESSAKGMYTLSIFAKESGDGVVKHYHIKKNASGDYYLTERHAYNSIPVLINYHKHNCAGLIVRLRSSPTRGRDNVAPATSGLGHDKYEIDPSELELMEDLGAGQFGTVKLAIWKNSKKVAVKMMKEDTMSEDDFIDEAKTMKELQHKNLVQLYGVSTKKKPIYIITEFMKHGSLLSYLRRHKHRLLKKVPVLMDMCCQVADAMEYLETKSFIHRDLAARNCLVGEGDICKVGDFGLARFVLDNEYTSSQGTKFPIRWAPPEVLSYTRFSTKSDVWSFGILMWEIFTGGDLPYGRVKNQEVVTQVCHQRKRLERPQKCNEPTYEVMLSCWEEKADNRPDFSVLRVQLEDVAQAQFDYA